MTIFFVGFSPWVFRLAGLHFVPSMSWTTKVGTFAFWFGLAFAIFIGIALLVATSKHEQTRSARVFVVSLFVMCAWVTSALFVTVAIPLIVAILAGSETELEFVLEDASGGYVRGCPSNVELDGMPFLWHALCELPRDFRATKMDGDTIHVIGRGTNLGAFYNRFR